MTSISIDFRYQSILIGGLNRLISMISNDFRYRFLWINYVRGDNSNDIIDEDDNNKDNEQSKFTKVDPGHRWGSATMDFPIPNPKMICKLWTGSTSLSYWPMWNETAAAEVAMASDNLMSFGCRRFSNCFLPWKLSIRSIPEGAIVRSANEGSLVGKNVCGHR